MESPLGSVLAHEPLLVQAVSNLIGNGIKFVPPGRELRLRIRTEPRDGEVRLWVEDNGIGISPEYQHRIWGMFERVHPKDAYEGTGIGLAIVRKAAERMGGKRLSPRRACQTLLFGQPGLWNIARRKFQAVDEGPSYVIQRI